jgi:hypothetical protein
MEINDYQNKIDEINDRIIKEYNSYEPIDPIIDGIIDLKKYLNAKYRILWILKEPYDEFNEEGKPIGGGWSFSEAFEKDITNQTISKTFHPIIYVSYCILNQIPSFGNHLLPYISEDHKITEILRSIAYINIQKLPQYKTSDDAIIHKEYKKHKRIILDQIELINPDVIILGVGGESSVPLVEEFFLDIAKDNVIKEEPNIYEALLPKPNWIKYLISNNKIYLHTYHPSRRGGLSMEQYCDDIINTANKLIKKQSR